MKNKMKQTQQRKKELEETKNRTKKRDRDGPRQSTAEWRGFRLLKVETLE